MKILVCCANGAGTSMMMGMKVKQAFKELGVDAKVDHRLVDFGHDIPRSAIGPASRTIPRYDTIG